jgi:hypothetical protein
VGPLTSEFGPENPSQALAFTRADIEDEFSSCLPSDSATRALATGDKVAELFLNFRDDFGAGGIPLAAVAQSGSEYLYSLLIEASARTPDAAGERIRQRANPCREA